MNPISESLRAPDPHKIALHDLESCFQVSFGALLHEASLFADFMGEHGVYPGDRVVIATTNNAQICILLICALASGFVAVPTASRANELDELLADCQPAAVIGDAGEAKIGLTSTEVRLFHIGPYSASVQFIGVAETNSKVDSNVALIAYTSGTTGRPKGTLLSLHNLMSAGEAMAITVSAVPSMKVLLALPMTHMYGISILFVHLLRGSSIYCVSPLASGRLLVEIILTHRINAIPLQPQHLERIFREVTEPNECLPGVEYVACGSGSLKPEIASFIYRLFPRADLYTYYALTEAPRAMVTKNPSFADPSSAFALGVPSPGVEILLRPIPGLSHKRAVGQIAIRGPVVALGYFGRPEETAASFQGDLFVTEDTGVKDENGVVHFNGRVADYVRIDETLINTWEVETRLTSINAVGGVIASKYVDATGEGLLVIVEANREAVQLDTIKEAISPFLDPKKARLQVVDHIPRNQSGKIKRNEAIAQYSRADYLIDSPREASHGL